MRHGHEFPNNAGAGGGAGEERPRLVYGGGSVGLMGRLASTVRQPNPSQLCLPFHDTKKGKPVSQFKFSASQCILWQALEPREVSGAAVGEVRMVPDMHTRKVSWLRLFPRCPVIATVARWKHHERTHHEGWSLAQDQSGRSCRLRWRTRLMHLCVCREAMAQWR